jgi:hypothetical protein
LIANADAEYLTHVGRRVSADEQYALSRLSKLNCRCASNRRLAHAAFAGEEKKARRLV